MRILLLSATVLVASLFAGCGQSVTLTPQATSGSSGNSGNFTAKGTLSPAASTSATRVTVPLPPASGYSGQVVLPVAAVPTGLIMTITYSNGPPSGLTSFPTASRTQAVALSAHRRSEASASVDSLGALNSDVAYACIAANELVILNGAPQYTFALPSTFDSTGVAYYAAIFSSGAWVDDYGGPGTAVVAPSSLSVSMAGRFGFSIPANGQVCVALYARSTSAPVQVPATSGTLAVSASTLQFASSATQAISATETGYSGTFSATSANTGIATVAPGTAGVASGQFVVTPVGIGTTTVTITGGTATTQITVVVTALTSGGSGGGGAISVGASALSFSSSTPQTFTVSEANFSGTFAVTSANTSVATVAPGTTSGSFVVTPVGIGTTTITISDGTHTATLSVTVTALSQVTVVASPVVVTGNGIAIGPGSVETLAVGGSAGVFTATTTCGTGSIATLTGSPGTTFTLTGVNVGSCAITITNATGQATTIPVSVSSAIIPVS